MGSGRISRSISICCLSIKINAAEPILRLRGRIRHAWALAVGHEPAFRSWAPAATGLRPIGIMVVSGHDLRGARDLRRRAGDARGLKLARKFGAEADRRYRGGHDAGSAHQGGARHRRRFRGRSGDGLLGSSERRSRRHRDAARRRHLCRDGPVHRRRLDQYVMAPHLHQRSQLLSAPSGQRLAARRRHALSHAQ